MNGSSASIILTLIEWLICVVAVPVVIRRDIGAKYKLLSLLLLARLCFSALLVPTVLFGGHGIEAHLAYKLYFYSYWTSFLTEAVLSLLIIYSIFNAAMAPLNGIKDLGEIVFNWALAVSIALTATVLFVPHSGEAAYVTGFLIEFQRAQGVLTLCLLLFVCLAIRPLGLTYRSRTFGVILGLGILATANLLSSGWLAYFRVMYSAVNVANSVATCLALLLWTAYFVVPEPKRSIVVLPTTSPYLQWNQVAQALGDPPGFVAIAGVPPELFAPAELEMLRLASLKMTGTGFASFEHSKSA